MRKLVLALMLIWLPLSAAANSANPSASNGPAAFDGVVDTCKAIKKIIAAEDNDGIWLTEYLMDCIRSVIIGSDKYSTTGAFEIFLLNLYPALEPIIQGAVTLAVVLFGVLLVTGMIEKTSRDSFVFLLKLAFIAYFVQTSTVQWVFESSIATLDNMTEMVFTFGDGNEAEGRCAVKRGDTLWDRVDCMLDVLIGIKKDVPAEGISTAGRNNVSPDKSGLSRGMIHFFASNAFSSGIGAVLIGGLGLYCIYAFVFAVIKSLHTYLAAVLALAFILMFMPIFVPMLFFKATRNYFDKWYRIAISFILQPVILFGFLSLMMIAYDNILVSGSNSITRLLIGDAGDTMVLSDALERAGVFEEQRLLQQGVVVGRTLPVSSQFRDRLTGAAEGSMATPLGTSIRDQGAVPGMVMRYTPVEGLNYERLGQLMGGGAGEAEAKERVVYAAIVLAMTTFIFISMLNYIPILATDLAGGVFEVPNLYEKVGQNFVGSNQLERLAQQTSAVVRRNDTMQQFRQMIQGRS